jgi:predicted signal transduction protein with EAL and GGDEF domain
MLEDITEWKYEKLVTIWEDANFVTIQESEIFVKTTVLFKKKSESLDKSINESKSNISKYMLQVIRLFFSLIYTISKFFLQTIIVLTYLIAAIAKTLLYVISFVAVQMGILVVVVVLNSSEFMWKLISNLFVTFSGFMWKSISSLVLEIKNANVKHRVEKPLQNQSRLYQLIVPMFFLLFAWIFASV